MSGMVVHAYKASPWETEAGIQGHPGLGEILRSFFKAVYEYIIKLVGEMLFMKSLGWLDPHLEHHQRLIFSVRNSPHR